MNFTHRTVQDALVEQSQARSRVWPYDVRPILIPAGTPGVIEYAGVVGGQPVVMFRCRLGQWNLVNNPAPNVERIEEAA